MTVYTKPGKQPSDTISCQNNFIMSTIFVVFFAYLPSNRSNSFALKPSYYQSEVFVGSMDRESCQQLQMWFSEHFFAPKLAALFVMPIVSATVKQFMARKNV